MKEHIVLGYNQHGLVGGLITLKKAKSYLKETQIFYVFRHHYKTKDPFIMKIKYPLEKYYNRLIINEYTEEVFEEDDDYVIITYDNTCDKDCLIITHKINKINN
jgi:hypothetical protein